MTSHGVYRPVPGWAAQEYVPSEEQKVRWKDWGFLSDDDVLESAFSDKRLIWGVPDKAKLFELSDARSDMPFDPLPDPNDPSLTLKEVRVSPVGFPYVLLGPPTVNPDSLKQIVEQNYLVRVETHTIDIKLHYIYVIEGDRDTDSKAVEFMGAEYTETEFGTNVRVFHVSVDEDGMATYELDEPSPRAYSHHN